MALIPLLLLLGRHRRRQAFFLGWLHGVVFWAAGIPWIAFTLGVYGQLPKALSIFLFVLLTLYLGIYHGLFALLARRVWQRGGGLAFLGIPALWVVVEHLQGHPFGGFPWNLAAYAWIEMPGALAFSAWAGAFGISFLVLWTNTGLALAIRHRRLREGVVGVLVPLVCLGVGGLWAASREGPGEGRPVRIVQPNIGMAQTADWQQVEDGYRRLLRLSREACDVEGALLIWPESAGWPLQWEGDPYFPGRLRGDVESLNQRGCDVLFNSAHEEAQETFNSAFLSSPQGLQRYDKRHLVPWGEYVPLGEVFPSVGKLARNAGNFTAGVEAKNLAWGQELLGPGVCYESSFPAEVAELVRAGATILVNVSNDAWYGDSAARHQLFRAVRFRAAENRRPVLRAAITGISAVITPQGKVEASLDIDQSGVLRAMVRGRSDSSFYTRWPGLIPWLSLLGAAFVIIAARRKTT